MNGETWWARLQAMLPQVSRALAYSAALALGAAYLHHALRGSVALLGLFEDDFFYYAVIADHLASLGKLTFDGVTTTNGFHPLWFVIVFSLRLVAGGLGKAFFVALALVLTALVVATYEALRVLAERLGAEKPAAAGLAVLQINSAAWLISSGMEVALAIPLFALLLAEAARDESVTPARAAKLGALASLAVLARLDLAIAVALLAGASAVWLRERTPRPLAAAAAFAVTCVPVGAYFAANAVVFGGFLPLSGQAKQLGSGLHSTARFF